MLGGSLASITALGRINSRTCLDERKNLPLLDQLDKLDKGSESGVIGNLRFTNLQPNCLKNLRYCHAVSHRGQQRRSPRVLRLAACEHQRRAACATPPSHCRPQERRF